ncbi:hypothetical protein VE04_05861 [Pseudogymnoascus sp. 24MN13]|nr:hypothetical protein VE04_05861 [Pseudogymnoascus sp. 24MN13]
MTYDLHGAWNISNKWLDAFLNAHTNLTEIADSLDLLWRNGIPSGMVNLGLAFYARTSTLGNTLCKTPGCAYVSAGKAGPCSNSVGTLTNAELADIITKNNLKPELFENEAVKIITWGDQWAAYDDGDTFKIKVNFAKSQCLGGVFIWAISQDSSDRASSKGLGAAVGRSFVPAQEITAGTPDPENAYCAAQMIYRSPSADGTPTAMAIATPHALTDMSK